MRFSCVASVTSAFHTGSPAAKLGVVVDGGCDKMVIMSPAACTKKSYNLISGNGKTVGKNVTVSQSLSALVRGK